MQTQTQTTNSTRTTRRPRWKGPTSQSWFARWEIWPTPSCCHCSLNLSCSPPSTSRAREWSRVFWPPLMSGILSSKNSGSTCSLVRVWTPSSPSSFSIKIDLCGSISSTKTSTRWVITATPRIWCANSIPEPYSKRRTLKDRRKWTSIWQNWWTFKSGF